MKNNPLPRLDIHPEVRQELLPLCRIKPGEIWEDPDGDHRVACIDSTDALAVSKLLAERQPTLAIHDPPYNLAVFETRSINEYISWCERWVTSTISVNLRQISPDS